MAGETVHIVRVGEIEFYPPSRSRYDICLQSVVCIDADTEVVQDILLADIPDALRPSMNSSRSRFQWEDFITSVCRPL